jgi:Domain of unknown function (DUF4160)
MPRISSFYGITIWMYYNEHPHSGRPHFHAKYGEEEASFAIENFALIAGRFPQRARRLVVEWARQHQVELLENWERARTRLPLKAIEPLG